MRNVKAVAGNKQKKIDTPFGYFGSKKNIALRLCETLPLHNCWVEAFCGSAALTLAKRQAPIEVINDIDGEIVNLFQQLRDNHEELCRLIALTPYAEEELINARTLKTGISNVERARLFLVQSMMAINSVFGEQKGGFSYSNSYSRNNREARVNRWYNLPGRLERVVERLKSVRIENKDARKLLKKFIDRPATLIYLDPPYLGDRTPGYNVDANDERFHEELLSIANKSKCMVFISGYENELYSTLLKPSQGWTKKTISTITKDSTGQAHKRVEVVWMNRHFQKGINSLPIKLTQKEKLQNKINPQRTKA